MSTPARVPEPARHVLLGGIGHDTAGVCGERWCWTIDGQSGPVRLRCSVRAGGGTGGGVVRAGWTGTKMGSGGRLRSDLRQVDRRLARWRRRNCFAAPERPAAL